MPQSKCAKKQAEVHGWLLEWGTTGTAIGRTQGSKRQGGSERGRKKGEREGREEGGRKKEISPLFSQAFENMVFSVAEIRREK